MNVVFLHAIDVLVVGRARACEARILSQAEILRHINLLFHFKIKGNFPCSPARWSVIKGCGGLQEGTDADRLVLVALEPM